MNVSDVLLQILAANGVKHLFGIPGDAINDITDAVRRQDALKFIQVRHEEAGAFAASAQAKLTGELAACMGTAGPGAIHLLNGLYDAKLDHAPVIAITGQVETGHIGTEQHQEVRLERLFADVAVYSQTVVSEEQVPTVFLQACHAAITHRGVAHISLPTNIASRKVQLEESRQFSASLAGGVMLHEASVDKAVTLINNAQRICLLVGVGCRGARQELVRFAEKLQAPIIRTLKAKEVIDDDHGLCIGGLGLLGGRPAVKAIDRCELMIMVGTDFPYEDFYPRSARIIQIDTDPTQIGKRHTVDVGLTGDAATALTWLSEKIDTPRSSDFLQARQKDMDSLREKRARLEASDAEPIQPPVIMKTLSDLAPEDAVFTLDTGTVTAWFARHLRLKPKQRYVLSGGLASMAFAFSGALGAQLAYPHRRVFALTGDGAFTMLMGDLVTAVKYELPVIVIVLNNEKLDFIKLEQEAKGLPDWGTELQNLDFAAFARACGGLGFTVTRPDEIAPALQEAIDVRRPVVIDIAIDPDMLIMPPKITLSQAMGFSMAKIRELFSE
ncbi:MAG: thiamine pyrophosphate-binding protein [Ketobacteraceae bacterium]|nr:thiamine pyrophosphate-binding protein [Ketobacteraceae bacterium]